MKTKVVNFDGVDLRIPDDPDFGWPHETFKGFPTCCGPGKRWGNWLVPDRIVGLIISPACWVHDVMFAFHVKSWTNFYYANGVFLANMMEINRVNSRTKIGAFARKPIIYAYVKAVTTTIGARCFFKGEIAQETE